MKNSHLKLDIIGRHARVIDHLNNKSEQLFIVRGYAQPEPGGIISVLLETADKFGKSAGGTLGYKNLGSVYLEPEVAK